MTAALSAASEGFLRPRPPMRGDLGLVVTGKAGLLKWW